MANIFKQCLKFIVTNLTFLWLFFLVHKAVVKGYTNLRTRCYCIIWCRHLYVSNSIISYFLQPTTKCFLTLYSNFAGYRIRCHKWQRRWAARFALMSHFSHFPQVKIDRNILKNSLLCIWIFINANSIDFNILFASELERPEIALENVFFLVVNNKYFPSSWWHSD